ncbi:MAG: FtsW/RodA/SpoVE family cell cycle protein [Lachnospiraceae bacterium]|nr:FtsW/RodA/SpoVE family cell cycle protein [Lachnospiraceae bacterium]
MSSVFCEISKYLMMILFAVYTYECFTVLMSHNQTPERQQKIFFNQNILMFMIHLDAFLVIFDQTDDVTVLLFYLAQVVFFIVVLTSYRFLYEKSSRLVVNNMCMLMMIGFIILTRLSYTKAIRQFAIAVTSTVFCLLIPLMIRKLKFIRNMVWLYGVLGILLLLYVFITATTSYGAKLSISILGYAFQPSEFVKIIFVFFVAGMFIRSTELPNVIITTGFAMLHVLILVMSKDLGSALIFFIVYLVMMFVATHKILYFVSLLGVGSVAAYLAYLIFSHVQTRVIAWLDPVSVIDTAGYQICQSLFAIGTGGWFGSGLYQGMPTKIPVVEEDFVFSAISEEMGGIFAICLILVCMSVFLMFLNIAMQMKNRFYKLVALGLGTCYGIQVFIMIGGVIKFIPSTGVTLPFISYGGSSILSTTIIFAIIQGFYLFREDEGEINVSKEKKETSNKRRSSRSRSKDN